MIKLVPIINNSPYYHVIFNYMIGDGHGDTTYDFTCGDIEIEEVMKYVNILNKLKPLHGYWGINFSSYPSEYPGEYIGLSKEEYEIFKELLNSDDYEDIKGAFCECLRDRTEYCFLVFQGIDVYYYDKFNTKYSVEIEL